MKNEILTILKKEKPILAKEFGVEEIGVFGSVATEMSHKGSDIDIIVKLKRITFNDTMGLLIYLEKKLDNHVDLVLKGNSLSQNFMRIVEQDVIYV